MTKIRKLCVTRAKVLAYMLNAPEPLDTHSIAQALTTDDVVVTERSVRAAASWLVLGGFLKRSERRIEREHHNQRYKVYLYEWTGKQALIKRIARDTGVEIHQNFKTDAGIFLQDVFTKMRISGDYRK